MRRRLLVSLLVLSAVGALVATTVVASVSAPPATYSRFTTALPDRAPEPASLALAGEPTGAPSTASTVPRRKAVGAALRSLALPGWGQLSNGHRGQAAVFGMLELGTWVTFATLRTQGSLRQDSSFDTARLFAGIDLAEQPDRLRRLVGQYQSSDVYNQYVVRREAAFFIEDPTERDAYIAEHSIPADQAWMWTDYDDFVRYREQRRTSELAFQRSRYALGLALVNRLVAAVAAARTAPAGGPAEQAALPGEVRSRLVWGVAPGRNLIPQSRLAWVLSF